MTYFAGAAALVCSSGTLPYVNDLGYSAARDRASRPRSRDCASWRASGEEQRLGLPTGEDLRPDFCTRSVPPPSLQRNAQTTE